MNKIFITLIFSFVCMFANATSHNKLHIGYTNDMCSDYYVLSVKKDTVYVTYHEYEKGTFVYYDDLNYFLSSRLTPLMNKLVNIHTKKVNNIKNEYKNLLIDINVVNPTYHKCKNNYIAFYEIGTLYNKIWKLIDKVKEITK